jgi:holo-[acyl-carrier protein] synthase
MTPAILCGTDLIAITRITEAVRRLGQPFLDRIWTAEEQDECLPASCGTDPASRLKGKESPLYWESLAARFAAKEAASKALGTGIGREGVRWTNLVVRRPRGAAPSIKLNGAALDVFRRLGGQSIAISLAHDAGLAQAFCVILADVSDLGQD